MADDSCADIAAFSRRCQIRLVRVDVPVFLAGLSVLSDYHPEKPAKKELGLVQFTRPRENDRQ